MTHMRTQIRSYVATLLVSAATDAEARVYNSRVHRIQEDEVFPLVNVLTLDEEADLDPFEVGPVRQKVRVELQIQAIVKHNTDYAANLDQLCEQIQNAMDLYLGNTGTVQSCLYKGSDIIINDEGSIPFAVSILKYQVTYLITEGGLPEDVALDDLGELRLGWDMAEPNKAGTESDPDGDGQVDAEDIIDNLQI